MSEAVLRVDALEAGYGGFPVLHGVDLEVASGEIVAVVGPNGAGKSTLLKTIFRLLPVQGRVSAVRGRGPAPPRHAQPGRPGHGLRAPGEQHLPRPERSRQSGGRAAQVQPGRGPQEHRRGCGVVPGVARPDGPERQHPVGRASARCSRWPAR